MVYGRMVASCTPFELFILLLFFEPPLAVIPPEGEVKNEQPLIKNTKNRLKNINLALLGCGKFGSDRAV